MNRRSRDSAGTMKTGLQTLIITGTFFEYAIIKVNTGDKEEPEVNGE